ncbi:amidohydrolase family protein [Maribacter sp. PR1]|uniref:Amidohydrolase family protein n=1 Tax=Maribacter cobaltidurans TaxID=1178778 RepID=A0ABU7IQI8_9FLAO|nr:MULTISPECIES: amidohydrolase family protein [Maribacter]MDC6387830.1 amidohydrolase family protein [Maribacter sp. PR1]MEE1975219.1 amidohydrolase family protein [Maribacter cobaltidurans]
MKKLLPFFLILFLLIGCSKGPKYDIVIENVGLFDGYKDLGLVNMAINSDTIAAITNQKLASDSIVDATGKYIIPGLVNAHVHANTLEDLKAGYPLGVLTLLNMHTGLEDRELGWKSLTKDSIGFSTIYGAGHAATVPGGHPTQFSPNMETITDSISIEDWMEHRISKKVDYIKIIHTLGGWMGEPAVPTLSYEQIGGLIQNAHEKGYKAVVHAGEVEEMETIAKYNPDGFVHMLSMKKDYPIEDSYYKAISESGAFVVPTAGINLKPMDGLPPFMLEWITNNLLDAKESAEIIKKMHDAGILIVAGTDAQEGQMNFGEDYFLELELYKMAGLSNLEVLKTATGNAAKAFDLPIGEIKTGSKATFVILNENPLSDLANLRKVEQVWKNGKTQ